MELQPLDDLVRDFALCPEGDTDQRQFVLGYSAHGCTVGVVMAGGEQLIREDGHRDVVLTGAVEGASQFNRRGCENQPGLPEHRQVLAA